MSRRASKERASGRTGSTSPRVDKLTESSLSDESRVFREAMRDVNPLKHTARVRLQHRATTAVHPRGGDALSSRGAAIATDRAEPRGESVEEILTGTEALSFRRAGVRDLAMRKLRRGLIPVEDELDLHGLAQSDARNLLEEFVELQREAGHRCVRIIHGKGYRSGARGPILKMLVNGWLKRNLDVLAFCSARPIDGGTGAVYVLLRV